MILRQARPQDAASIARIYNHYVAQSLALFTEIEKTERDILAQIDALDARYIVAEQDDVVIGMAYYTQFRAPAGYAQCGEHSIYLAPDQVAGGTGRALLARLEQIAIDHGVHVLVAGIGSTNTGSIAFHERAGYRQTGYMPEVGFKQGTWLDLVLMQKTLQAPDCGPDNPDKAG